MDVITGILGETEFKFFDADDFGDFYSVMNEMTAWLMREYMLNPSADKEVVAHIDKYLGDAIRSITLPRVLTDKGILKMLQNVNPGTILAYARNNPECYENLKFLEDNYHLLRPNSKVPTAKEFQNFKSMIGRVLSKEKAAGFKPTYPDIPKRIQANSFMFYSPHTVAKGGAVGMLHARHNMWHMFYRGLDFDHYCMENNITNAQRRMF